MTHLCIYESTKLNLSKSSENANQPARFVVFTKSMFQLVTSSEESKLCIYWVFFVDIVIL